MSDFKVNIDNNFIKEIIAISQEAGDAIMAIYKTDFDVQIKDDFSPVTKADKKANAIIEKRLKVLDDRIPILSEEGQDIVYADRKKWDTFWLVDPLDGTKDFIKKNNEFTVNIALIKNKTPIFGVVYAPAIELLFWGSLEKGAWKKEGNSQIEKISVATEVSKKIKIAASRSHPSGKMKDFLCQFEDYQLQPMGSSLKICLVADGTVDLYPRLGPTMEWDTAAAHAVLKSAGGEMMQAGENTSLIYNKKELLNPEFISGYYSLINKLKY